ncbi:hypothetical protein FCL42_12815 [Ferrimonas aestuarii]|uniref:DUF3820 family protein n=1 Tax=Ferrimonas aestuarii TaxID=2569539 RepID=A0A4U1BRD1_9GAMM|nr:hypothetical protein FCL42_12815 [Ferrimonas aestuarii]
MQSQVLRELATERMPFGKYQGVIMAELPIAYLVWMQNKGWPKGALGEKLAQLLEIKHNGLGYLLNPLKQPDDSGY